MIDAIDKFTDELMENLRLNGYDMLDADDRALIWNSFSQAMTEAATDAARDMRERCAKFADSVGGLPGSQWHAFAASLRALPLLPLTPAAPQPTEDDAVAEFKRQCEASPKCTCGHSFYEHAHGGCGWCLCHGPYEVTAANASAERKDDSE